MLARRDRLREARGRISSERVVGERITTRGKTANAAHELVSFGLLFAAPEKCCRFLLQFRSA